MTRSCGANPPSSARGGRAFCPGGKTGAEGPRNSEGRPAPGKGSGAAPSEAPAGLGRTGPPAQPGAQAGRAAQPRWGPRQAIDAPPAVVIAGPTASGKTALALALAEALGGEIVSFDSMQLYRGFVIGAAQPTAAELARVPHHFIAECDPRQPLTAGEYSRQARLRIRAIVARGRLVVLVGGTGFYLRALLDGLFSAPPLDATAQAQLRRRLRDRVARRGPAALHAILRRLDAAAAGIAPRDAARTIRALEVRLLTGQPISRWWAEHPPEAFTGVRPLLLGLAPPRAELYRRIDLRAQAMFAPPPGRTGIVAETRALLQIYSSDLPVFAAHGYKQAVDILRGRADPAAALAEAQAEQRHYAKRQFTWFRRDPRVHWLPGFGGDAAVQRAALQWLQRQGLGQTA